jgi:hypothetical protein
MRDSLAAHATLGWELGWSLDLSIGSARFQILFPDEGLHRLAAERYRAFEAAEGPAFPIRLLDAREAPSAPADFSFKWQGATLRCRREDAVFSGVRNEYALDSLLRVLLSWTLLPQRGFLLHAATIVRGGRAFVFTGPSGAGKSTLASLAPEGTVLTDEISLLRQESAEWSAFGTPFWGEFHADGKSVHAKVAGIFQLLQAPHNRIRPMSSADAVRMLLPNVLFFSKDTEASRRLLDLLALLAQSVPCYRFEFRRDASLWEALPA